MVVLTFKVGLLDFESELAGNGLELMAKDMRTQPTSQNSIHISKFVTSIIVFVCFCRFHDGFTCFEPQNVFMKIYSINLQRE